MKFRILFAVSISHAYYSQGCKDFSFIIPAATARLLKNGKLIAKIREGKLLVLFAADEADNPLVLLTTEALRIGLKLLNPFFSNFTNFNFDFNSARPLYRNSTNSNLLDAPQALVGKTFSHSLTDRARPVTVTLKDSIDRILQTDTIAAADNRSNISYNLHGQAVGIYTVEESYSGSLKTVNYYFDPYYSELELQQQAIFGFIEIAIADSFYTAPPEFTISFTAKQETLKYYAIAQNYSDTEFNTLSVVDGGEAGRLPINFIKVLPADFTDDDISPNLLGNGDAKIALFKSQTAVKRQEKARQKIQLQQLQQQGDAVEVNILIPHLPQPGVDQTNADLIVQLSKPKP